MAGSRRRNLALAQEVLLPRAASVRGSGACEERSQAMWGKCDVGAAASITGALMPGDVAH